MLSARRPCLYVGCPQLVERGYCAEHRREVDRAYRHGGRAAYRTKRWHRLRRTVLLEEELCRCGCGRAAEEVDHVVPVEDGGSMWSRANLQGLAHVCHSKKTRADVAARRH